MRAREFAQTIALSYDDIDITDAVLGLTATASEFCCVFHVNRWRS